MSDVLDEILRGRGYEPNFEESRSWKKDDVQFVDVDLSVARTIPESLGLAGKRVFIALEAYDDRYTFSGTKTTGKAIIALNEPNGNPIPVAGGMYFDFRGTFNDIFIRNAAQTLKSIRIYSSVDSEIKPFSAEIQIVGNNPSVLNEITDKVIGAGATVLLMNANGTRKRAYIKNIGANPARLGDTPTNTQGAHLAANESIVLDGSFAVSAYSNLGTTLAILTTRY